MPATYFILGASGGIGSTLARRLAASGARLALAGRRSEPLRELAASLDASAVTLDGASFQAVDDAVARAYEDLGRLDGIVDCAGSLLLKPAHLTTEAEWKETLSANLDTAFATVRAGARTMMKSGGAIVLVSSAAARVGLPNHEAIAAAKAGVTLPHSRIRVNVPAVRESSGARAFKVGYGVEPDVLVVPTLEDVLAGRDPVLEAALSSR